MGGRVGQRLRTEMNNYCYTDYLRRHYDLICIKIKAMLDSGACGAVNSVIGCMLCLSFH